MNEVIFTNKPNMDYIMQVLCDLLTKQDGGEYEYTYTLKKTEEVKNETGKQKGKS